MKYIKTGNGSITLLSLLAIWSISTVVDLPGLAITPMMSSLTEIFPHVSHLEIQLLGVLPNFFIIPFILLSGHLSVTGNKLRLINIGMLIFLASGIAYFFAKSMAALIVISCLLGVGCGLVIPLAAGVIADFFSGVERMKQMGIKSGIANFSLIFATMVVGWTGGSDWHLSFIVYLMPLLPLCLAPFLSKRYLARTQRKDASAVTTSQTAQTVNAAAASTDRPLDIARSSDRSRNRTIWGIMAFYFCVTICTITISYYLPFLMQDYHMADSETGIVTAIFFLFITLAGFFLAPIVRKLGNATTMVCMITMIVGMVILAISRSVGLFIVAVALTGIGYGLVQPIFYNKASLLASTPANATKAISYIMTANYLGTAVTPLFFTGIGKLFHIPGHTYAFWLGIGFLAVVAVLALIYRRSYVFYTSINDC